MNVSSALTKDYENEPLCRCGENKPNQTQPVVSLPAVSKVEPSNLFQRQKNAAAFDRVALQAKGFVRRVWTRGYDKRYCFDEKSLKDRMDYVGRHKQLI